MRFTFYEGVDGSLGVFYLREVKQVEIKSDAIPREELEDEFAQIIAENPDVGNMVVVWWSNPPGEIVAADYIYLPTGMAKSSGRKLSWVCGTE